MPGANSGSTGANPTPSSTNPAPPAGGMGGLGGITPEVLQQMLGGSGVGAGAPPIVRATAAARRVPNATG